MGPRHTYESSTAYSTIDYIWVDNYLVEQLKRSEVMNMHSDNVTHHLPVEVTIMFPGKSASFEVTEILTRPKVAWKKCTAEQFCSYQNSLDENLHSLSLDSEDNPESIEKYVRAILESVNIASTEYELKEYEGMAKAAEHNHDAFWIIVNSRNRRRKELTILEVDRETLDDAEHIVENWANYFEDLHRFQYHGNSDNVKPQIECIAAEEDEYVKHQNVLDSPISICELQRVIESLPNGKAPGIDGICYEHVKFGGEVLLNVLCCSSMLL